MIDSCSQGLVQEIIISNVTVVGWGDEGTPTSPRVGKSWGSFLTTTVMSFGNDTSADENTAVLSRQPIRSTMVIASYYEMRFPEARVQAQPRTPAVQQQVSSPFTGPPTVGCDRRPHD